VSCRSLAASTDRKPFRPAYAGFMKHNLPAQRHSVCPSLCNASLEIRMDAAPEPPLSLTRVKTRRIVCGLLLPVFLARLIL
jgi:hypothetical protein